MSGLNSKYPLAIVADAPKDLLKLQGALAQPNHSRGRGPEHGNYRGVSASEQPQLGRAVRRAKCEWAWEGDGVEVSGVALTYLSVFPGLHLLPPCRAPGLLPPSDGSPRLGDPTAAGEHFQGEQYCLACRPSHPPPRPGDKQKVLCAARLGQPRLWFQGNRKLYLPLTKAVDRSRWKGHQAGGEHGCPTQPGPRKHCMVAH